MFTKFGLGGSALIAGFWLDRAAAGHGAVLPVAMVPLSLAVLLCCLVTALLLGMTGAANPAPATEQLPEPASRHM